MANQFAGPYGNDVHTCKIRNDRLKYRVGIGVVSGLILVSNNRWDRTQHHCDGCTYCMEVVLPAVKWQGLFTAACPTLYGRYVRGLSCYPCYLLVLTSKMYPSAGFLHSYTHRRVHARVTLSLSCGWDTNPENF